MIVKEQYQIMPREQDEGTIKIIPFSALMQLQEVKNPTERHAPRSLVQGMIKEVVTVEGATPTALLEGSTVLSNEFVRYNRTVKDQKRSIVELEYTKDHVPVEKIEEYSQMMDKIKVDIPCINIEFQKEP